MAALASRRPRDPWRFLADCFADGKVPERSREQQEEAAAAAAGSAEAWDDRPPFLVYFEPALVRAQLHLHHLAAV